MGIQQYRAWSHCIDELVDLALYWWQSLLAITENTSRVHLALSEWYSLSAFTNSTYRADLAATSCQSLSVLAISIVSVSDRTCPFTSVIRNLDLRTFFSASHHTRILNSPFFHTEILVHMWTSFSLQWIHFSLNFKLNSYNRRENTLLTMSLTLLSEWTSNLIYTWMWYICCMCILW